MRTDADHRARYHSMIAHTGLVLILCGPFMLIPLTALLAWPTEAPLAPGFIVPGVSLVVLGLGLRRLARPRKAPVLNVQEGGVIVLVSWIAVTVASAVPFMATLGLDFVRALFESVSGWTTTGLSVVDVENAPRMVLLWRSTMQLAGGAGMAVILLTLAGGPMGPGIAVAEGRGDLLVPHVRRSARLVLGMYAGYAAGCILALRAAGMSWFDAVNHAFATVSTGGFSTHAASLGYWDSPLVEAVTLPFMLLGATNFQVVHLILRGRVRDALRGAEPRTAGLVLVVAIPLVLVFGTSQIYVGALPQVRVAIFEAVTAITTTGFSTSAGSVYHGWPRMGISLLLPLMLIGGGTGSTAGGIKQHRAHLLAWAFRWELRRLGLPGRAIVDTSVWRTDQRTPVSDRAVAQTAAFVAAYLALYAAGVLVLIACGYDVLESLFEFASALGTVGLSLGVTGAATPNVVLWVQIAGMFLGRLEIFIVLVALRKLVGDGVDWLRRAHRRAVA